MLPLADDTSTRRLPIVSATLNNGVAFFAHVGGFVFGLVVTKAFVQRLSHQGEDTGWGAA